MKTEKITFSTAVYTLKYLKVLQFTTLILLWSKTFKLRYKYELYKKRKFLLNYLTSYNYEKDSTYI